LFEDAQHGVMEAALCERPLESLGPDAWGQQLLGQCALPCPQNQRRGVCAAHMAIEGGQSLLCACAQRM
jgi:hypothetical protein